MTKLKVDAGGETVRVLRRGSGPVVVLVHGLGLSADFWRPHLARLAAAGYDAIAPDMPGFGRSSGPAVGFVVDHAAAWLADFADAADVSSAVWVGHSVSAQYVLRLCTRRPDLVRALVLAAPTGEPGRMRWLAQLVGLARTSVREPVAFVGSVLRSYATTPPLRTAGSWLGARRDDPMRDAAACRCPLRVVLGERDPVVPPAFARRLAAAAPHGDLVVIPGSAHGVAVAPAAPFCSELLAFLERLDP